MRDISKDSVKIHEFMIKDLKLTCSELIIYALAYQFYEKDMEMVLDIDELSAWTTLSSHQVQGLLWQLQERGLISVNEREGLQEGEYYTLEVL